MSSSVKKAIKNLLRPVARPVINRMHSIVRTEIISALRQTNITPPPPPHTHTHTHTTFEYKEENNAAESHDCLSNELTPIKPYRIDPHFFANNLSPAERMKLFRDNVQYIIIESCSFCNRKCWFCSNRVVTVNNGEKRFLSDKFYFKLISELESIDYRGDISFAACNEPLFDKRLVSMVEIARKALPNCKLHLNTNGDYLNKNLLQELYESGIDRILISIYADELIPNSWKYDNAKMAIQNFAKKLNLDIKFKTDRNNFKCLAVSLRYKEKGRKPLVVLLHSEDHTVSANYRGGILEDEINLKKITGARVKSCIAPFVQFIVYSNGDVMPCSDLHPDFPAHKQFIAGNIAEENIFNIFSGEVYKDFRSDLLACKFPKPCEKCIDDYDVSPHYIFDESFYI